MDADRIDDLESFARNVKPGDKPEWFEPYVVYSDVLRLIAALREALTEAEEMSQIAAAAWEQGWKEGASAVEFRGFEAHDTPTYNPYARTAEGETPALHDNQDTPL